MRRLRNFRARRSATNPRARQGVQVIARAAEILRALEGHSNGLSLGQIANQVNLPRSTVQRIIDALEAEHFVVAASPTARVRLGPALVRLASSAQLEILHLVRPYLEALSAATGETVDLAILNRSQVLFIDQIPGTHRLRTVSAIGASFPLHSSASGKALLAALDDAHLSSSKRVKLKPMTRHTMTSWAHLQEELDRIRATGVAYDREEHSIGICAVASALRGPAGELVAISIPTPTQRFVSREAELTKALLECCNQLQDVFGTGPAILPKPGTDAAIGP